MFVHRIIIGGLLVAAIQSTPARAPHPGTAARARPLPRPPGVRVETLPREAGDKPQESVVAINPRNPRNIVVSYHQAVGEGSDHHPNVHVDMHVASTMDGGRTWSIADATHKGYRVSIDSAIMFDSRGHAYLVYIGMDEMTYTTRNGEFLLRSTDGGRTWEAPRALAENPGGGKPVFEHIPYIAADIDPASRYVGNVYMVWTRNFNDERGDAINFTRSTDGGESWSTPKVISRKGSVLSAAVGRDGALYLLYGYWNDGWEAAVAVSRDGGETFSDPLPVARGPQQGQLKAASGPISGFPRAGGWPSMALDPRGSGRLFVVWGDHRDGDRDILSATSVDGGRSWTAPVRVNDDPPSNGRDQLVQIVAVDPTDGAAYVLFYDRRNDANNQLPTVTLARSADGGRTFANYDWNNKVLDPKEAVFGDYIGLAARGGKVYGAWVENLAAEPGTRRASRTIESGNITLDPDAWPYGPAAIRIGVADFNGH